MNKKGQYIIFMSIFMLFIFFLMVTLFADYLLGNPQFSEEDFSQLQGEAVRVADSLMLTGYPADWDETTVERVGLVDNNRLNETKLNQFTNLISNDYYESKKLIGVQHDYVVFIQRGSNAPTHHGDPNILTDQDLVDSDARSIAKQDRVLLDENGGIVHMYIYVYKNYS